MVVLDATIQARPLAPGLDTGVRTTDGLCLPDRVDGRVKHDHDGEFLSTGDAETTNSTPMGSHPSYGFESCESAQRAVGMIKP